MEDKRNKVKIEMRCTILYKQVTGRVSVNHQEADFRLAALKKQKSLVARVGF